MQHHLRASLTLDEITYTGLATQFDSNGDGQISISELREAMKKLMGEQLNPRDIDEIIRDVDLNGDGQVDFEGQKRNHLLNIQCSTVYH